MNHAPHFLYDIFKKENFKEDELQLILEQFESVAFKKNDYLIERGKKANFYYFLQSGFLRSITIDLDGKDITTNFF